MEPEKKKRPLLRRLRDRYRMVIYNDNTFEEVFQFRLSRLYLLTIIGSAAFVLIVSVILLIAFTPLREFIPGYPDSSLRTDIVMNALQIDSLEQQIIQMDQYIQNINSIISGQKPKSSQASGDTAHDPGTIKFTKQPLDSVFRKQIEDEDKYNLVLPQSNPVKSDLTQIHFFTPLKGVITNEFNMSKGHYGIDIVSAANDVIKAALEGVVIIAAWTLETGYVIQIQHPNNLITVYKHNADLLKKVGDRVQPGDPIAIVGNSGELSTGPHLHFELWHNGVPINPKDHILF